MQSYIYILSISDEPGEEITEWEKHYQIVEHRWRHEKGDSFGGGWPLYIYLGAQTDKDNLSVWSAIKSFYKYSAMKPDIIRFIISE